VTDVFPLPVEGAETRVLADDTEVQNYMITLGESLEMVRTGGREGGREGRGGGKGEGGCRAFFLASWLMILKSRTT